MFVQQSPDTTAISEIEPRAKPDPANGLGHEHDSPSPLQDTSPQAGADAATPNQDPTRRKRGRPRTSQPHTVQDQRPRHADGAQPDAPLVAETSEVISNLQRQGVLKPPAAHVLGGGPGHRTKNCRPVQINVSETMFRQLKMIAATQSISIKDQIIAALLQQGYKG